jgi:aspartate ammonia-lyase
MPSAGDSKGLRLEQDLLGERSLPEQALYGIHTLRAMENFPLAGRACHPELIRAYGLVKLACAEVNQDLGVWRQYPDKAAAILAACREMASGGLQKHVLVDALQGGAGTSLNMNVNEVLANRALQLLGQAPGDYGRVSPHNDLNRHQSTNDTFPTALRVAAMYRLKDLEERVVGLQEAFQDQEKRLAGVVKVGRTQLQDAVLITLGREMGAYAEAFGRDRWRIYKCQERLRVVNLGGTAVGTGLGAPRRFILRVTDRLRKLTGLNLARAENLVEATQNADVFTEVSGILKACAVNLVKVATDLRLLASGPRAGLGEIRLPPRQAGSSIMPGKVNPVIPEAVTQAGFLVMGHDQALAAACAAGSLELNPFLPLVAHLLLESCDLLERSCRILRDHAVAGLSADETRCRAGVEGSVAVATALLPRLGYTRAEKVAEEARRNGRTIRATVLEQGLLTGAEFDELVSPEAVCRLGTPLPPEDEVTP